MPLEVKAWLDERASYLGWPPFGNRWAGVLRCHPLSHWVSLRWERRTLDLRDVRLTELSQHMLEDLSAALFRGATNAYSTLGTNSKLPDIGAYIHDHGRVPGVLILLEEDGAFDVVDGCHRLCVYAGFKSLPSPPGPLSDECDAWVGTIVPPLSPGKRPREL